VVVVLNSNEAKHFPCIFYGGKNQFFSPVTRANFRASLFDWLAFAVKLQGVKNQFPRC